MPNPVFDGLPDIFTESFGEPVIYTPVATSIPSDPPISAIWRETSADVVLGGGEGVAADSGRTTLSVRAADVPAPAEGDTARRVSDGKLMIVSTPILPDGKGMISCNLT